MSMPPEGRAGGPAAGDIVAVDDLVVVYPDGTRAVDGVSFRVREGEFFGFLGPNGAGKSTTIKTLTTLLRRSAGRVSIAGHDPARAPAEVRKVIGVLSQETVLDVDLTGRENVRLFGRLQHVPSGELDARVDELLRVVELEAVAEKPAGRYSGGMRKRLDLASALVHRPRLLFLDEPTTGLDPQSRASLWEYLEVLNRREKVTIFLTTQYMEEADRLCSRIAIIDRGRIIGGGSPEELKGALGGAVIAIGLGAGVEATTQSRARKVLEALPGVSKASDSADGVTATVRDAAHLVPTLLASLERAGIDPASVSVAAPTLDDVFLELTGRKIRSDELDRKTTDPFLM